MTAAHIICVKIPLKIESLLNKREHWRAGLKRKHEQRNTTSFLLNFGQARKPEPPCQITLTRIAPRELDDDNLAGGFKHVRDGVADWLGIDDGDKRLTWKYAQRKGAPKEYAAEITIEATITDAEGARTLLKAMT